MNVEQVKEAYRNDWTLVGGGGSIAARARHELWLEALAERDRYRKALEALVSCYIECSDGRRARVSDRVADFAREAIAPASSSFQHREVAPSGEGAGYRPDDPLGQGTSTAEGAQVKRPAPSAPLGEQR